MKWLCQLQFQAAFGNLHHTPTKHPQCLQLIAILHETYPLHVLTKDGNVWEFTLPLTFSSLPHKPGMDLILHCWIRNMNNGSFPVVWHISLPAYDHNSTFRLGWQAMLTNQHLGFLRGRKKIILGKVDEQLQVTLTFLIFVHKSNNTFCQLQKQKHHNYNLKKPITRNIAQTCLGAQHCKMSNKGVGIGQTLDSASRRQSTNSCR